MKNLMLFFTLLVLSFQALSGQEYKKLKITLDNGTTVSGKNGVLSDESLTVMIANAPKTYNLSDLQLVQAKEGKAGKWALGFGGCCAGVVAAAGLISGSEGIADAGATPGQYVLGGVIWTGIFAGIGALVGSLLDDWETVYVRQSSSMLNNFNLHLSSNELAKYNLTLSYTIPIN